MVFLVCYLGTLGASLLGNLLSGKEVNGKGNEIHRAGEGVIKAAYGIKENF